MFPHTYDNLFTVVSLSINFVHTLSPHTAVVPYSNAHYGQGTGLVLLDQLFCSGTETRLIDCSHGGLNSTQASCGHDDDAGVQCGTCEWECNATSIVMCHP